MSSPCRSPESNSSARDDDTRIDVQGRHGRARCSLSAMPRERSTRQRRIPMGDRRAERDGSIFFISPASRFGPTPGMPETVVTRCDPETATMVETNGPRPPARGIETVRDRNDRRSAATMKRASDEAVTDLEPDTSRRWTQRELSTASMRCRAPGEQTAAMMLSQSRREMPRPWPMQGRKTRTGHARTSQQRLKSPSVRRCHRRPNCRTPYMRNDQGKPTRTYTRCAVVKEPYG